MNRGNSASFETCAQPALLESHSLPDPHPMAGAEADSQPVEAGNQEMENAIEPSQNPIDLDPSDSQDTPRMGQAGTPSPCLESPESTDTELIEMLHQVGRVQTVLVSMQATCPKKRFCAQLAEQIEAVLTDSTIILSASLDANTNVDEILGWKEKIRHLMEAFKEVKEVYDGVVDTEPLKKQLRRHPTDEASDNNDVDDNSPTAG